MKDAYSFDRDFDGLDKSYDEMYEAYEKIFTRCGLTFRPVEADTGAIGGSNSHEFTALSEVGESAETDEMMALEEVDTPGTKTIEDVANFLGIDQSRTIKALLFITYDDEGKEKEYVAAFIRGDRELNMIKLINALGIHEHSIEFADEAKMAEATGCVGGFTGPIGLHDCKIVVDSELTGLKNLCAGANKEDYHVKNVNYDRDYKGDIVADLKPLPDMW